MFGGLTGAAWFCFHSCSSWDYSQCYFQQHLKIKLRVCGVDLKPLVVSHWSVDKIHTYLCPHPTFVAIPYHVPSIPGFPNHSGTLCASCSLYVNCTNTIFQTHQTVLRADMQYLVHKLGACQVFCKKKMDLVANIIQHLILKSMGFQFLFKNQKMWHTVTTFPNGKEPALAPRWGMFSS